MTDAIQVITTTSSREEARKIARALVERRLAACVQVSGPIASTYRWQGAIETSEEWMCTAKTRSSSYAAVESAIRELHSYDVPEILAIEVTNGSRAYLDWLAGEVT
jgi:periplasmic divalent cation tolerance protein